MLILRVILGDSLIIFGMLNRYAENTNEFRLYESISEPTECAKVLPEQNLAMQQKLELNTIVKIFLITEFEDTTDRISQ